jgi:hypothetical protein
MAGDWNRYAKLDCAGGHAAKIDVAICNALPEQLSHQGRRILLL